MLKLSDLIGDYEEAAVITHPALRKELPIESPQDNGWTLRADPTRLTRLFKFSNEQDFNAFIMDILEHQAETNHHGRITLQWPKVKTEVWTHHLNDVTDVDMEWAESINQIYGGYNGR